MFWQDLQEVFYLVMAPFLVGLLLPVFVGTGIILAVVMGVKKFLEERR